MKKTLTEAELRQLVAEGKTHQQIAQMLERHPACVSMACSLLGIHSPLRGGGGARKKSGIYYSEVASGKTIAEVAAKHGVQPAAVTNSLTRAGLPGSAREIWRRTLLKAA